MQHLNLAKIMGIACTIINPRHRDMVLILYLSGGCLPYFYVEIKGRCHGFFQGFCCVAFAENALFKFRSYHASEGIDPNATLLKSPVCNYQVKT